MLASGNQLIQYIQPFAKTCKQVFKSFVGVELVAERPYIFDKDEVNGWDLFAIIGFSGEARGAVVISMEKELAFKLTTRFTGKTYTALEGDVLDTISEITNIIAGNVKQGFENAFRLIISLPITVKGYGHSISWLADSTQIICLPFRIFEKDEFMLSISLEKKEARREP